MLSRSGGGIAQVDYPSDWRTPGGHRRYDLLRILSPSDTGDRRVACYARVSSHDQRDDLARQAERLRQWGGSQDMGPVDVITDLGSASNDHKCGLLRLVRMICRNEVSTLVVVNSDRLLRFGFALLETVCRHHGTRVICLDASVLHSFEQELATDVIGLMTSICARLYGKRSHQNKRRLMTRRAVLQ